jgi:hypothetical protein
LCVVVKESREFLPQQPVQPLVVCCCHLQLRLQL